MQCVEIDPSRGFAKIANAGHPYPVHYSVRRGACDILRMPGDLLHSATDASSEYEEYMLQVEAGDVLVLLTDGLTEGHIVRGDAYGYRFSEIINAHAADGARAIGQAILDGWKAHSREGDVGDDVTVVAISVTSGKAPRTSLFG